MASTLPIGDFSRATHLSVKMLRHYHELGLLEPVDVDLDSGYRRYAAEQIVTAQVIRRFCDLDMPLYDIHAVLQLGPASALRAAGRTALNLTNAGLRAARTPASDVTRALPGP